MNERMQDDDKLLTLKEALAYLRIGRTTLYRFMDDEKVKGYKVGNNWRFYASELRSFVRGNEMTEEVEDKVGQG